MERYFVNIEPGDPSGVVLAVEGLPAVAQESLVEGVDGGPRGYGHEEQEQQE